MPSSDTTAEEKSPLLQPESPEEKYDIPEDVSLKEHNRAVYQGVATVVKRWPDHISSGWAPVIYMAFFTFTAGLVFICFMYVLSRMKFSLDLHIQVGRYNSHTNETLLDFVISCEGQTISTTRFPSAFEQLSRSRFSELPEHQMLYHLTDSTANSTADGNIEPLGRMFFIAREEDITTERLCSVESAAYLLPNTTVYFVILHNDESQPSGLTSFAEYLQTVYKHLSVHRIGTKRYFSGSPLSETFENGSTSKHFLTDMIEFAARVLTLWRNGGVSVDSNVAIRNGSSFPGRNNVTNDDEVVLSETGSVISVGYQCHELLFQIMSTLAKFAKDPERLHTTSKEVITTAVKNFCFNQTTTKSHGVDNFSTDCPGVSLLKSELLCNSIDTKGTCLWKPANTLVAKEKTKICPLTLKQFFHSF